MQQKQKDGPGQLSLMFLYIGLVARSQRQSEDLSRFTPICVRPIPDLSLVPTSVKCSLTERPRPWVSASNLYLVGDSLIWTRVRRGIQLYALSCSWLNYVILVSR